MTKIYHNQGGDAPLYSVGYQSYLRRTSLRAELQKGVEQVLPRFLQPGSNGSFPILDIGCGDGAATTRYLASLDRVLPSLHPRIDLVEPSQSLMVARAVIGRDHPGVKMASFAATAERFVARAAQQRLRYGWIIASHVFYHIQPTLILGLARLLNPRGLLMITMGAKKGRPLFDNPLLRGLSRHGDFSLLEPVLVSPRLTRKFHVEVVPVRTEMNIGGLLRKNGKLTREGEAFFSFIYNRDVPNLPSEVVNALCDGVRHLYATGQEVIERYHNIVLIWPK